MSKVIKSPFTQTDENNKRVITLKPLHADLSFFDEINKNEDMKEPEIDLIDVEEKAAEIIREAEKEAVSILKEAEKQLQEMMQQIEVEKQNWAIEKEHWIDIAKQEGYSHGFDLGKQEGFSEYKSLIELAKNTVEQGKIDYYKNIEQAETTILHLGIKAAEKIMGFTLDLNTDVFMNLVKRVIKEVKDHHDVQIHVHPMYYHLVLSQKEEIRAFFNNPITELYVYPNDELNQTDCIIESSFGRIDASIDSQLNELKVKLLQLLEGEMEDEDS